jgi:drug/metabolite transporter (DMT)-like permease
LRKWFLLISVVALWGSSFALLKLAVESISPVWVMALRLAVAGATLLTVLFSIGARFSYDVRSWLSFLAIAVVGNVIPFLLISWGIKHIPSSLSGILMAVMPLGVAVLAHFFLPEEPLNFARLSGFLLGFLGVVILLAPSSGIFNAQPRGPHVWGELAVIAGAVCYSIQSIITRRIKTKGALETATAALVIAGVIGLLLAFSVDPSGMKTPAADSLVALLILGLFNTALATVLYFLLIKSSGAGFASMINYLIPLLAVLMGWIFLDERLPSSAFAGLAFILLGIALVQSAGRVKH